MSLLVDAWSCVHTTAGVNIPAVWMLRYIYVFQAGLGSCALFSVDFIKLKIVIHGLPLSGQFVYTPCCVLVMCEGLPFCFVCYFPKYLRLSCFNLGRVDIHSTLGTLILSSSFPFALFHPPGLWSLVQRLWRTYCSSLGGSLWKEFCLSAPTQAIKLCFHFPARQSLPYGSNQWRWEVWPTSDYDGASSHCRCSWIGASDWATVGSRSWGVWGGGYVYKSGDKSIILFQSSPYALVRSFYFVSLTIYENWWCVHCPILGLLLSYRRHMAFTRMIGHPCRCCKVCVHVYCWFFCSFPFQVDCRGYQGLSPLLLACRHGHDSCVSLLVSHGASVNVKSTEAK